MVVLLHDNATFHPESMEFSDLKILYLPKNTTSRLQPLDAGIIQNCKVKYRKLLAKHVLSRINDNASVADIKMRIF